MNIKDLSFEQALQELEAILSSLEKGHLTLEEALQGFERGVHLTRHCQSRLKAAEQRVEIIMQGGHKGADSETIEKSEKREDPLP